MARIARIKAEGEVFYHVVSRIANKAFLLNNDAWGWLMLVGNPNCRIFN